jgi:hypothetical protein
VLSCQNYDDEFAALNSKVASLESQISSLAGLQTALTQVQSSVSALQAAVSAIPNLSSEVAAILADLDSLAADVAGATTSADLDALKSELSTSLAALQALIEANSTSIANLVLSNTELKSALTALGVDVDSILAANATFEGNLTITNAAELAYAKSLGNKVATIKGDVYVSIDATSHTGGGDGTGLTAAQVNSVTSQITYVVGNVKIDTDETLDLSKLANITGDYIVKGHDVSDDALISVGDDVHFDYDGAYVSNIQTADNIYLVAKARVAGSTTVTARTGTTSIDFLALTKATGIQTVSDTVANQHTSGGSIAYSNENLVNTKTITVAGTSTTSATTSTNATTSIKIGQAPVISVVGGNNLDVVELHYAADVSATNTTGSAALASLNVSATSASSVTVMARTITGAVSIDVTPATATAGRGSVSFPNLVSVGGYSSDALENASFAKLTTIGTSGLVLDYDLSVDLPVATVSGGVITLSKATSFTAPVLARVGSATATVAGSAITANEVTESVSLPALTKAGAVSMTGTYSFSAPLAKIPSIDIKDGTTLSPSTIDLGSLSTHASVVAVGTLSDASNVGTLKLNNQDITFDLTTVTTATSITYKGKAAADGSASVDATISSANSKLVSLTLGGVLDVVSVNTNAAVANSTTANTNTALSTIVTSGTIQDLTVENNYDLTTLTLGHTEDAKSQDGANLKIRSNNNLTSLTTSVTRIRRLEITGNKKLGTFDLSSISQLPANWTAAGYRFVIVIEDNETNPASERNSTYGTDDVTGATSTALSSWYGVKGVYTAANATQAESHAQASLATLKPFLTLIKDKYYPSVGSDLTFATGTYIKMEYRYDTTGTSSTASTALKSLGATAAYSGHSDATDLSVSANATAYGVTETNFEDFIKLQ